MLLELRWAQEGSNVAALRSEINRALTKKFYSVDTFYPETESMYRSKPSQD